MNLARLTHLQCEQNYLNSVKGLPENFEENNLSSDYFEINRHGINEISGTSKFRILSRLTEDSSSFFSWALRDKNNL